ncbi:MAG: HEPN domain-containing protein [Ignavibacteria bacterium]|nr:HEPN domain-containing protein [Ignavibacteria bacterium]
MRDKKHAEHMLTIAGKDLSALRGMAKDEATFHDEIFGFHAQQTVEKCLKAILSYFGVSYPKTHDLLQLESLCMENEIKIPEEFSSLSDLTDFAVEYRYDLLEEEPVKRSEILASVEAFFNYVQKIVQ